MVHVVERRVLLIAPLQRVPRQSVAAVVVDALHDGDGAEAHGLADGEAGKGQGEGCADGVEEEGFREGVVEGAEGVGDVDLVVMGVKVTCFREREASGISCVFSRRFWGAVDD